MLRKPYVIGTQYLQDVSTSEKIKIVKTKIVLGASQTNKPTNKQANEKWCMYISKPINKTIF